MSYEYKNEIIEDVKAHCKTKNKNIAVYPVYHYEDKVEEIHNVYSQATKVNEYEAKVKSYTKLVSQISAVDEIVALNYDKDMTDTNLHLLMLGAEVKRFFESGEYDA